MSSLPDDPKPTPEFPADFPPVTTSGAEAAVSEPSTPQYPVWNGWDVLDLVFVGVAIFFGLWYLAIALLPGGTFQHKANRFAHIPELALVIQFLTELMIIGCMYLIVAAKSGGARFWKSVQWNWPQNIGLFLFIGILLQIVFLFAERFLPFPKQTPFDIVLKRPYSVLIVTILSVTLAPLFEELFFRGFLYSVLRRTFGVSTAIIGTAVPFGLAHLAQYGYSWASLLLIFVVGVVLAAVREKKESVAASFLVHVAYNSVLVLLLAVATDGFRHLEKLSR